MRGATRQRRERLISPPCRATPHPPKLRLGPFASPTRGEGGEHRGGRLRYDRLMVLKSNLRARLLAWYDANARALPWRIGPAAHARGLRADPYAVWLSEVMLQQTTVPHATPYFLKFLQRWPTVSDPRGPSFSLGDVIPLDWQSSHWNDLRVRVAPNLSLNPLATPDFRTSVYLEDAPQDG